MGVLVITDSTAAIPRELVDQLDILVVPMRVEVGGKSYLDGALSPEELVSHLEEGLKTSAPSPGDFVERLSAASGDGAVVLTVASRLSATYASALTAARISGHKDRIAVIDTKTAAGGQGLVVLAAARAAAEGLSLDAVAKRALEVSERVHLVAAVAHVHYLVRGGRMPTKIAHLGEALGLRILFELRKGWVYPVLPRLSEAGAMDQILAQLERTRPRRPEAALHASILHSMRPDATEELKAVIEGHGEHVDVFVTSFGSVMLAHTGPGILGLAWWWE
jgi:DegV family protein with EDD domain